MGVGGGISVAGVNNFGHLKMLYWAGGDINVTGYQEISECAG